MKPSFEADMRRRLQNFDAVWERASRGASRSLREAAAAHGIPLMPKRHCCRPAGRRPGRR